MDSSPLSRTRVYGLRWICLVPGRFCPAIGQRQKCMHFCYNRQQICLFASMIAALQKAYPRLAALLGTPATTPEPRSKPVLNEVESPIWSNDGRSEEAKRAEAEAQRVLKQALEVAS